MNIKTGYFLTIFLLMTVAPAPAHETMAPALALPALQIPIYFFRQPNSKSINRNLHFQQIIAALENRYGTAEKILNDLIYAYYPWAVGIRQLLKAEKIYNSAWLTTHQQEVMLLVYGFLEWANNASIDRDAAIVAARFHDIGKMSISIAIIDGPDISPEQRQRIRNEHVTTGARLYLAAFNSPNTIPLLYDAIQYHHEGWNGGGVFNLSGDAIPYIGRLIAIADAISAMLSHRTYENENGKNFQAAIQNLIGDDDVTTQDNQSTTRKVITYDPELLTSFLQFIQSLLPDMPIPKRKHNHTPVLSQPASHNRLASTAIDTAI